MIPASSVLYLAKVIDGCSPGRTSPGCPSVVLAVFPVGVDIVGYLADGLDRGSLDGVNSLIA